MTKIDESVLDKLQEMEVQALMDALNDEELRTKPQILACIRKFLADNKLKATPEIVQPVVAKVRQELPKFDFQ